jgi:sec-independent protein translocase protein TatA
MFQNIGFTELLLIAIVALVIFGPQKLPEIGRMLGKTIHEFKKGARDLMEEVKTEPSDQTPAAKAQKPLTTEQAPVSTEPSPETSPLSDPSLDVTQTTGVSAEKGPNPDAAPERSAQRRLPD